MREPAEFEIVGQNPVRQRGITEKLFAVWPFATFHFGKVSANILRLDIPKWNPATRNFEIWSADERNMLRFVGGNNFFADRLEQCLKRGTMRVFRGVVASKAPLNFGEIRPESHGLGDEHSFWGGGHFKRTVELFGQTEWQLNQRARFAPIFPASPTTLMQTIQTCTLFDKFPCEIQRASCSSSF